MEIDLVRRGPHGSPPCSATRRRSSTRRASRRGAIGAALDITDRKRAQELVEYQAYHDSLTALPNRLLFRDRITVALAHARRSGRLSAVMFLDLDQFKLVNDTLGHTTGDRLLQAIGRASGDVHSREDTVARMGGDEFTILLADVADRRGAALVAQKILGRAPSGRRSTSTSCT